MTHYRIEFRQVSKYYGTESALKDVSFAVPAGEHVALIGPSGCGKTTALRLLAGLDDPSGGKISIE
ncbi:MAG: ATP-binding cassette domain-containing protein, partial [Acidobacteriota bacterium]